MVLETLAAAPTERIVRGVRRLHGVRGCAVLVTCQRSELYVEADDSVTTKERVRKFFETAAFRAAVADAPPSMKPTTALHVREEAESVRHLLRVAAGLESNLVGEQEIVGQVRQAYTEAHKQGCMSTRLDRLFQTGLKLARSVRTQPGYALRRHSYVKEAISIVGQNLGGLAKKRIAVVGAGQIGRRIVQHLQSLQPASIVLLNRSAGAARAAIAGSRASYRPLGRLQETLEHVDSAIFAVNGGRTLYDAADAGPNLNVIVDLSVVPAVKRNERGPPVLDLQFVTKRLAERHKSRPDLVDHVSRMADDAASAFYTSHLQSVSNEAVRRLGTFAQEVETKELQRALRRLGHLRPADQAVIEALARSLRNKLLLGPTLALAQSTRAAPLDAAAVLRLFGVVDGGTAK